MQGQQQTDAAGIHTIQTDNQQQPQQPEGQQLEAAEGGSSSTRLSWKQRLTRYGVRAIQAIMLLELAAIFVQSLLPPAPAQSSKQQSEDDLDPADILMDYFTGRRGITALQLLNNKHLRQAVDNLVTEDYEELGVKDRGAAIRSLVEDVIRVREEGPRKPPEPERVGLGKLGPLRYRNTTPARSSNNKAEGGSGAESKADSS